MPTVKQTSKTYLRALQTSYVAMTISIVGFSIMCWVMVSSGQYIPRPFVDETIALVISGAVAVAMFLAGQTVYRTRTALVPRQTNLRDKTKIYRSAMIVRLALFNAGSMIPIVFFLLNGYPLLFIFPGMMILLILSNFPNRNKMLDALQPNLKEMEMLDDPDKVIDEVWYSRR